MEIVPFSYACAYACVVRVNRNNASASTRRLCLRRTGLHAGFLCLCLCRTCKPGLSDEVAKASDEQKELKAICHKEWRGKIILERAFRKSRFQTCDQNHETLPKLRCILSIVCWPKSTVGLTLYTIVKKHDLTKSELTPHSFFGSKGFDGIVSSFLNRVNFFHINHHNSFGTNGSDATQ